MFSRRKFVYLNYADMSDLLEKVRNWRFVSYSEPQHPLANVAYINDKITKLEVTVKFGTEAATYVFDKTGEDKLQEISGLDAYIQFSRAFYNNQKYTIPDIAIDSTSKAILRYRNDYDGMRVHAYAYDQNSSYGWAMCQPMPDTREILRMYDTVKEGEIGFNIHHHSIPKNWTEHTGEYIVMVNEGEQARWIFNKMDSPFKKFAETWYKRKQTSEGAARNKAKQMIVYSVGYLQHHNPILRAAILEYANKYMLSLIDRNTVYVNTDCIVSLAPRDDIPIGDGLGEFKLEHEGMFAHVGFNHQWDYEVPSYRGIPKAWFPEHFDILKDKIPSNNNTFEYDRENVRLYKRCHQTNTEE